MNALENLSKGQAQLKELMNEKGHENISNITGVSVCRLYELTSGRKNPTRMSLVIAKKLYDNLEIEPFSWFDFDRNI